jgi:uncharacterized protein (TIGR00299 family) protein
MKTLYFDCFSGISGDMTIGALLDLGLDFDYLKSELRKLPVEGYELSRARVVRANLSAMKFDVRMEKEASHSRSHSHEHGGEPHHHEHDHHEHHHHEDEHGHDHGHSHFHRKASQILEMIRSSGLSPNARKIAESIFTKLAISEGNVHHIAPEDVEFHEVGAVDSIVDTVGAAIGFDALGIERFLCSPINVGGGFIHCQHGVYPVPAPATADLLRNATVYSKHVTTELVTPTGAAILAAVVSDFTALPGFSIKSIGYGAGSKQFQDFPNCLRLFIGEELSEATRAHAHLQVDEIMVIEANIDDMTPQNFGYVMDRLLENGALDAGAVPMQMKKGRPGHLLQVLAPFNRWEQLTQIIFEETTTIGIRRHVAKRTALEREIVQVQTPLGSVGVKVSRLEGRIINVSPEYDDCVRIAREHAVPLKEVQAAALRTFSK